MFTYLSFVEAGTIVTKQIYRTLIRHLSSTSDKTQVHVSTWTRQVPRVNLQAAMSLSRPFANLAISTVIVPLKQTLTGNSIFRPSLIVWSTHERSTCELGLTPIRQNSGRPSLRCSNCSVHTMQLSSI